MTPRLLICVHRSDSPISRLIRWQTRGKDSHVSLLFPGWQHVEAREFKGVISHDTFTPEKGDTVDFFELREPLTRTECDRLLDFIGRELGAPYDWQMVLSFVTRGRASKPSEKNWFCSEFAFAALREAGRELFRETEPWEVPPQWIRRSPLLVPAKFDPASP